MKANHDLYIKNSFEKGGVLQKQNVILRKYFIMQ
jgi:hypothetical protein